MNRDYDYTYAVARVRANELSLLSAADVEQLIVAGDYKTTMHKLSDSGWGEIKDIYDYASYLENYFAKTWDFLVEILDDIHELDLLIVKNDMQNLKAALKSIVTQHDAKDLYVQSTVYNTEEIKKAVDERAWRDLPDFMQGPAEEAYEVLTATANGQLADAIIDKATLERIKYLGIKSGSSVLAELAERMCATANIKTALRCANTGKSKDFVSRSLCECDSISKDKLVESSLEGVEAVLRYLEDTKYAVAGEKFKESTSLFEKWCDDILMECVNEARYTAFGIAPIVAYYVARDAEIKTVRIILSAKINNLPADVIRERVRSLYV
ncbi:MAG: V-type ATPase subunit [Clostridia bacterium]|nr:V-type ATPase subunit [Clostridia bacterium]MBR5976331.1 V-type ATPase subunit [Clostridia bacterium]MBR6479894.1 V-type ATPase subunit [Clostridia bacterium]MBR6511917.1 V-type ATPase subunit [Clostridia bacterium]